MLLQSFGSEFQVKFQEFLWGLRSLSVAYLSLLLVEESARVLVLDSVLVREGLGRDLLIGNRVVGSRLKIKKARCKRSGHKRT